jgi:hypothetical protein
MTYKEKKDTGDPFYYPRKDFVVDQYTNLMLNTSGPIIIALKLSKASTCPKGLITFIIMVILPNPKAGGNTGVRIAATVSFPIEPFVILPMKI